MTPEYPFHPDLLVEVTSVCDRKCPGCYAWNFLSKESPIVVFQRYPHLFLEGSKLEKILRHLSLSSPINQVGIRGGEPSRHPGLSSILEIAHHFASTVFLETHGAWITTDRAHPQYNAYELLLKQVVSSKAILKLSFDRMHGLSVTRMREITDSLDTLGASWVIAVTEDTWEEFEKVKSMCLWIPSEQFVFQKKATAADQLIQPRIGVIHVDGRFTKTLNVRPEFEVLDPLERIVE